MVCYGTTQYETIGGFGDEGIRLMDKILHDP